ncbi:MAG: hypothetical protein ACJ739_02165 [Acidimicrobiales bacterium]
MAEDSGLYASDPARRLDAARALRGRARKKVLARTPAWPPDSPGACNAWLLFVTTKPPSWRDPLHQWVERPLTLGEPHEGFLYPDPIGFWDEVRRWAVELLRLQQPTWSTSESLSLTTLVHVGRDPGQLAVARELCRPRVVVFLDEPAWQSAGLDVATAPFSVPDPHRPGQVYEGWWGTTPEGSVVGKSPQHPTMHRLYRADDLTAWLRAAPRPRV